MKKIDRKVEWVLNMRIGTINMQGQPIAQIDRMRFQTQLKKELREIIIDKQIKGLINCLDRYSIDVMACQEMNYSYIDKYEVELEKVGYELLYNKVKYNKPVFTVVGFIVKKVLKDEIVENSIFEGIEWTNKYYQIHFNKYALSLVTVHVNPKDRESCLSVLDAISGTENIILIGDFNAATEAHREMPARKDVVNENTDFLKAVSHKGYFEIGKETNYTYITSNCKNKIDHVFVSECLMDVMEKNTVNIEEHLVDEVEHSHENGFTDHNMIWFDIDTKILKKKI